MAMNWDILKTQYLRNSPEGQIDSLSLNLARLQFLSANSGEESIAYHLIRESQFFIEWTVSTTNLETDMPLATDLLTLQRQLSQWKLSWTELWSSDLEKQKIAKAVQLWCDQLRGTIGMIAS